MAFIKYSNAKLNLVGEMPDWMEKEAEEVITSTEDLEEKNDTVKKDD